MDNIAVFPDKSVIKEEAGAWIVRIDRGNLSESEVRELQAWVHRSDFNREYLLKLAANWDAMGMLEELAELFPLADKEQQRAHSPSLRSKLWSWLEDCIPQSLPAARLVASVLTVAMVFTLGWLIGPERQREFSTAVGEQSSYTLEDGSRITLNTNSEVRVDYTGARRAIILVRGEANFDVAKNPERPFVVYAGGGIVWAVGTAFNVRYLGDAVDVTVTEGRVKVFSDTQKEEQKDENTQQLAVDLTTRHMASKSASPTSAEVDHPATPNEIKKEALLDAGQSLRYSQVIQTMEPVKKEELDRKLAWQKGALVFKGETLDQALVEIARYTDKQIVIVDPDIGNIRVGGHYKTDDINALLSSLGEGFDINVEFAAGNRILLSSITES